MAVYPFELVEPSHQERVLGNFAIHPLFQIFLDVCMFSFLQKSLNINQMSKESMTAHTQTVKAFSYMHTAYLYANLGRYDQPIMAICQHQSPQS